MCLGMKPLLWHSLALYPRNKILEETQQHTAVALSETCSKCLEVCP